MAGILFVLTLTLFPAAGGRDDGKRLSSIEGWGRVEDPDGDCDISMKDGRVTFIVPGGEHDLAPGVGKMNAPRILQEIEGGFSLQVKVTSSIKPEIGFFRSGTLLIWHDDRNFVRLDSACKARGDSSFDFYCCIQIFKDGNRLAHEEVRPLKDESTLLRLERRGRKLVVSFKQGMGEHWVTLKEQEIDLPRKLKVGVAAVNTTRAPFTLILDQLILGRDVGEARLRLPPLLTRPPSPLAP